MVYPAKKGGAAVHHTSLQAMKEIDGIETPDMEITDAEFEASGCTARIVDGEIATGKTDAEKQAEENAGRVLALKDLLAGTGYTASRF